MINCGLLEFLIMSKINIVNSCFKVRIILSKKFNCKNYLRTKQFL